MKGLKLDQLGPLGSYSCPEPEERVGLSTEEMKKIDPDQLAKDCRGPFATANNSFHSILTLAADEEFPNQNMTNEMRDEIIVVNDFIHKAEDLLGWYQTKYCYRDTGWWTDKFIRYLDHTTGALGFIALGINPVVSFFRDNPDSEGSSSGIDFQEKEIVQTYAQVALVAGSTAFSKLATYSQDYSTTYWKNVRILEKIKEEGDKVYMYESALHFLSVMEKSRDKTAIQALSSSRDLNRTIKYIPRRIQRILMRPLREPLSSRPPIALLQIEGQEDGERRQASPITSDDDIGKMLSEIENPYKNFKELTDGWLESLKEIEERLVLRTNSINNIKGDDREQVFQKHLKGIEEDRRNVKKIMRELKKFNDDNRGGVSSRKITLGLGAGIQLLSEIATIILIILNYKENHDQTNDEHYSQLTFGAFLIGQIASILNDRFQLRKINENKLLANIERMRRYSGLSRQLSDIKLVYENCLKFLDSTPEERKSLIYRARCSAQLSGHDSDDSDNEGSFCLAEDEGGADPPKINCAEEAHRRESRKFYDNLWGVDLENP